MLWIDRFPVVRDFSPPLFPDLFLYCCDLFTCHYPFFLNPGKKSIGYVLVPSGSVFCLLVVFVFIRCRADVMDRQIPCGEGIGVLLHFQIFFCIVVTCLPVIIHSFSILEKEYWLRVSTIWFSLLTIGGLCVYKVPSRCYI